MGIGYNEKLLNVLKIKEEQEIKRTLRKRDLMNRGLLTNKWLLLCNFCLVLGLTLYHPASVLLFLLLFSDFIFFLYRRQQTLSYYNTGKPRLETLQDLNTINILYEKAGNPLPTMVEYDRVAGLATSGWKSDIRYEAVSTMYQKYAPNVETVLDVGTNDGRLLFKYGIGRGKTFIGIDIAPDLVRRLQEKDSQGTRVVPMAADAMALPLKDESVDFITCLEALEHLPDPRREIHELSRVLRKGGVIVIQSPSAIAICNLNPFHVLSRFISIFIPLGLQRIVVHENTWVNAMTYHWEFTRRDIREFCQGTPLRLINVYGARYSFNPKGNILEKACAKFCKVPLINQLVGGDLTVVLEKG